MLVPLLMFSVSENAFIILLRISMDSEAAGKSTGGPVFLNAEVSCSPQEMKFSQAEY